MISGRFEPIEWERVSLDGKGRWVAKSDKSREKPEPCPKPQNKKPELMGSLDYIRNLICDNREGIMLLISVLLICDCDDSVEMLIALAVFLYPLIKGSGQAF
ncbi:MAG: hypothetical protein IKZ19_05270 [Clostridia bacterium]|nr:hypothetical protein [Clostridia bacterium]